jgi:hypothetical protein
LGLFKEVARGISLAPQARLDPDNDLDRIRKVILDLVLSPVNNPGLGGAGGSAVDTEGDGSLADDFTRAAAWVLSQDTYTFGAMWPAVEELLSNQRVSPRPIQNDVRWHGFVEWATFLGLGWASSGANINLDPAASIKWALRDIFGKQQEMKQDTFLQRLAEEIPVIDGGKYRLTIESTIGRPWRSAVPNELSPSLSAAMNHLEAGGVLRLEQRSDAPATALVGRDGRVMRRFSHVLLGKAS